MKEKVKAFLTGMKKEQVVVYVLLLLLLIVIALPVKKKDKNTGNNEREVEQGTSSQKERDTTQVEAMEQELSNALSKVDGVGKVDVVITLESTNQKIVEKDRPTSENSEKTDGEGRNSLVSSGSTEESTVYEKSSDGGQSPYVVSETFPEVRGVLVIAEGGDNAAVKQQISEGIMALFRVDAHKIKVMKMK